MLRDEGYVVSYRSTEKDWKKALERPGDLVVAAGGDGTIAKVARQMAHRGTPLTVMPLGTANNIARPCASPGMRASSCAAGEDRRPDHSTWAW